MKIAPIALRGILLAAALLGRAWGAPAVGEKAPPLRVTALDGTRFDLSLLSGQVVVVNYWATWCPPCRKEMPELDAFYARLRDRGVRVIGLSVDRKRDRKEVLAAAKEVHYPIAIASEAEENGFGTPAALPVTYLVGPEGAILAVLRPGSTELTESVLNDLVAPYLPKEAG